MERRRLYLNLIAGITSLGIIAIGLGAYLYSRIKKSPTIVLHFCTNFKKKAHNQTTSKEMHNKTLLITSPKQSTLKKTDFELYAIGPEVEYMRLVKQGKCISQLVSSRREMFCQRYVKGIKKGAARLIRYVSEPRLSVIKEDKEFFIDKEREILSLPTVKDYDIKVSVTLLDLNIKWKCYWLSHEDKVSGDFNEKFEYESFTLFRTRRDKDCIKETLSSAEDNHYIIKLQIKGVTTFIVTENEEWALSKDLNLTNFEHKIADQRIILQYEEIFSKRQEFYKLITAQVGSQVPRLPPLIKALAASNLSI